MAKINPAQLMLEFFPVDAVAKINEAQIRDFKRAYWEHSETLKQTRDNMSDAFIERLAMDTANAKQELRQMMRRSRYWDEKIQAWAIPIQRTIPVNENRVCDLIFNMWYPERYNAIVRRGAKYFLPKGEEDSTAIAAIEEIIGKRLNTGTKKTKVFMKVSKALGVYTTKRGSTYQKLETQLFTAWEPRVEKDTLYVSINPAHFLSMSNPKGDDRGEMLTSCHSFNGRYEFKSGCIGYARDDVSLIAFTAADNGDGLLNRKTARQMFFYKDGALIQSRLYTSHTAYSNGGVRSAKNHWEYGVFIATLKAEISRCEGVAKIGWKTADYRRKIRAYDGNDDNVHDLKTNRFCVEAWRDERFNGYSDWEQFANEDGMIRVSVRKDRLDSYGEWNVERKGMDIGAAGLSIRTAEETYRGESITA